MITVRRATEQDSEDLFAWRNDPVTRAASVSIDPVSWAEHSDWFAASLANRARWLFIVMLSDAGEPDAKIGMCRFDVQPDGASAEVSINLNPDFRGRGLAGEVLRMAIQEFRRGVSPELALTATIRPANQASISVFERAGFRLTSTDGQFGYYTLGTAPVRTRTGPS